MSVKLLCAVLAVIPWSLVVMVYLIVENHLKHR
jgi:hypothetical protein